MNTDTAKVYVKLFMKVSKTKNLLNWFDDLILYFIFLFIRNTTTFGQGKNLTTVFFLDMLTFLP